VARILIAEDEPTFRDLLADILEGAGHAVVAVGDGEAALAALERGGFELLLTDQRMPRLGGLELLRRLRALPGAPPAIMLTAHGTIPEAVEAVRLGAADYLTKPLASPRALLAVVERVLAPETADREFVTAEPAVLRLLELVDRVAARDIAVLITGETGAGKELVARRLHRASPRAAGPFVAVNCAAFPENLAESELFGHERGAFTGAERQRAGRFEEASGGTLFLDEVGELALPLQAKLLRVLEERRVRRIGGSEDLAVDVRVVAATNRDLEAEAERGTFRRDLYFRLAVLRVDLPPLRERPRDIPLLADHLLRRIAARLGGAQLAIGADAEAALARHTWPGNVRELRNALERAAVVRGEGVIGAADLGLRESAAPAGAVPLDRDEREREAVLAALRQAGGNREAAARLLGVSVRTLYYRLQRYGIT
jgi:two-component system response regulator FlrC